MRNLCQDTTFRRLLCCVVDDADMQITHVLRGEDHLYNTSRQVLLYDALQLARPQFVHLSLILGEDRTKLKKRDGREGTFVDEYRTRGFLPVNYVIYAMTH
jgi:glutamyl/glutaminyl-tRNA synthetase